MKHVPALDGIRALAALLVVLTHVGFWAGTAHHGVAGALAARGDLGVAVFFVLSGTLLTRTWLSPRPGAASRYFKLRAARILPAYWLALAAVVLSGLSSPDPATVVQNALLVQVYTLNFLEGFTQTWSLGTEVAFYLVLPVLARPLRGSGAGWWLVLLAGIGLASTGIAAATQRSVLALSLPGHLAWFAGGMLLATIQHRVTAHAASPRIDAWVRRVRADPGTLLLAAGALFLVAATPLAGPLDLQAPTVSQAVAKESLYGLIALAVVAAGLFGQTGSGSIRVLGSPVGMWAGKISYGVFLWHLLVLEVIAQAVGIPLFGGNFWFLLGCTVTITAAIAWLSYGLLERPLLDRVHQRARRQGQSGYAQQLTQPEPSLATSGLQQARGAQQHDRAQ